MLDPIILNIGALLDEMLSKLTSNALTISGYFVNVTAVLAALNSIY